MKDSIGEYYDNPTPSLINKPFYQDIYPENPDPKANIKSQDKETNVQSANEKKFRKTKKWNRKAISPKTAL